MLDKKYNAQEKEQKWLEYWKENKIYEFKVDERKVYSIDTPPPTVSGNIHIGHIFSYSQTEMIARYKRLRGYNVFYPFGFDDNGLPSERLVERNKAKKLMKLVEKIFQNYVMKLPINMKLSFKSCLVRWG